MAQSRRGFVVSDSSHDRQRTGEWGDGGMSEGDGVLKGLAGLAD